ncbi:peptidoglycan DD-metalloendopeptidase family protein [Paenibacillus sp. GCM10027627]|uniref:peptidoglycan DD-metalloendopeptidase family protein n=1 Tax=unclassified Paenibacillus TaxID=185978 RepID=UPI0036410748
MGLIKDVKQRRHDKIKSLLDQYSGGDVREIGATKETNGRGDAGNGNARHDDGHIRFPDSNEDLDIAERVDLRHNHQHNYSDPETAWKRNPNPWVSWETGDRPGQIRSYVKSQHTDYIPPKAPGLSRLRRELVWKSIVSLAIFGGAWGMYHSDEPWAVKGQALLSGAFQDEIDFTAAATWYKDVFAGAPSFIPIFQDGSEDSALVDGKAGTPVVSPLQDATVVRTFADLLSGIEIAGEAGAEVVSAETGRVIQVTEEKDSVLIQHANDRISIYGKLGSANVEVNEWVEAGQTIGRLPQASDGDPVLLYFAIKQNDRYVDPLDVIPID